VQEIFDDFLHYMTVSRPIILSQAKSFYIESTAIKALQFIDILHRAYAY
jgi:hypothetical protein